MVASQTACASCFPEKTVKLLYIGMLAFQAEVEEVTTMEVHPPGFSLKEIVWV